MGTGYLRVAVTSGNEAAPVKNAQVVISANGNGIRTTLNTLSANENGVTSTIRIETPPKSASLVPAPNTAPYRLVDATITAPGYRTVSIDGIPIFDDEGAVLPVSLLPCEDCGEEMHLENAFSLLHSAEPRQQSAGNGIENGAMPPEVSIPENITVHLGAPDDPSVPNVQVPFIDYLKNVASHEIYPTWPDRALEANILAEISLALNRIFTQWYPSRGYPFHITASPIFDQNYSFGGVIYERISRMVDHIFNQYIRQEGTRAPFFASFCNGVATTCGGLSQWGSVELANQGQSTLEILRHYYPRTIDVVHTNTYSSSYEPYPGTPLRQGDSGENVRKFQNYLNRIGQSYPMIPRLSADGQFGAQTSRAVKVFQETFALPPDGVIGKSTWNKISQVYIALRKLDELAAEGENAQIAPQAPSPALQEGSSGTAVANLQLMLDYVSCYLPPIPPVLRNGIFDQPTKRSVMEFQRLDGLNVDGIVGAETWQHLYATYHNLGGGKSPLGTVEEVPSENYPGTVLSVGSRGADVRLMQQYLNQIGRAYPAIPTVTEDGEFGYATRAAVIAFQQLFDLSPDGLIGRDTWNRIVSTYHGNSGVPAESYPGYFLKAGAQGNDVRALQTYLSIISDHYPEIPKVRIDGDFGAATTNAVRAYQRLFGLKEDGSVGPQTWNSIIATYNKSALQTPSAIQSMARFMVGKIFFGL